MAGQVKTRLQPALGAAGAAALAERLLEHAVAAGLSAGFADVELCAAPDASHPAFTRLAARHPGCTRRGRAKATSGRACIGRWRAG